MGCHTWWYRKVQKREYRELLIGIINYNKELLETFNHKFDRQFRIDEAVKFAESAPTMSPKTIKTMFNQYSRFLYESTIVCTEDALYRNKDLDIMLASFIDPNTVVNHILPIPLHYDAFNSEFYIEVGVKDCYGYQNYFNSRYYKTLIRYKKQYDIGDAFRGTKYDTWINSYDDLKHYLETKSVYYNGPGNEEYVLEGYQKIANKFGNCKIYLG